MQMIESFVTKEKKMSEQVTEAQEITEAEFRKMLVDYPFLHDGGMDNLMSNIYRSSGGYKSSAATKQQYRAYLEGDFQRVLEICLWIQANTYMTKKLTKHSSYGWKHVVEKEIDYVSNGEFIAAALLCGYKIEKNEFNPRLNMKLIKESARRIKKSHPYLGLGGY